MDLDLIDSEGKVQIEVGGIKFNFRPVREIDTVFAMSILKYIDMSRADLQGIDLSTSTKHVFAALQGIEGEIKAAGETLTLEKLKELHEQGKLQFSFTRKITVNWAYEIARLQGFLQLAQ